MYNGGYIRPLYCDRFSLYLVPVSMAASVANPGQQNHAIQAPSYSHDYPSSRKVKLAAVKEGLFHPRLPTFRRMDMDTAAHKLPEEHCRTATQCGPGIQHTVKKKKEGGGGLKSAFNLSSTYQPLQV